jgi:cobalt-zinc-cadmium efflux system membrane fusion protein
MSGYLTSIKMHNGMYVQPEMELMEIVNEEHLHLELDIFEKDIAKVKKGQRISYSVPAMGEQSYPGEVHVIGKEFNRTNKTVRVHGHLEVERPSFIKDLFVEAKIWLNDQTVQALPEAAIIKDGASSYIYVTIPMKGEDLIEFEALRVVPGTSSNGYTAVQLLDKMTAQQVIVTEGAYYVYAQSKAGELEHSH